jgi:hypothetical protein
VIKSRRENFFSISKGLLVFGLKGPGEEEAKSLFSQTAELSHQQSA